MRRSAGGTSQLVEQRAQPVQTGLGETVTWGSSCLLDLLTLSFPPAREARYSLAKLHACFCSRCCASDAACHLQANTTSQPLSEEFFSKQLPESTAAASRRKGQCLGTGEGELGFILDRKPRDTRKKRRHILPKAKAISTEELSTVPKNQTQV